MQDIDFLAGAAQAEIQTITEAAARRRGIPVETDVPGNTPYQLRCLVWTQGEQLAALFNADWGGWKLPDGMIEAIVSETAAGYQCVVLSFPTVANHNIDFDEGMRVYLDPDDRRFDPEYHADFVAVVRAVFRQAFESRVRCEIRAGCGICDSVTINSLRPDLPTDPVVRVLRFDARPKGDERIGTASLRAVLVNFSCRSDDVHAGISAGIPGSLSAFVQRACAPVPVFYLAAATSEYYKVMPSGPEPPVPMRPTTEDWRTAANERLLRVRRGLDRVGRVLGGEVCKVLAELETAGEMMEGQNQRHLDTAWQVRSPGIRIEHPVFRREQIPVVMNMVPPLTIEECEAQREKYAAAIKEWEKRLPWTPRNAAPLPLYPSDTDSPGCRWMEAVSQYKLWGERLLRAKQYHQQNRRKWTWEGQITLLTFGVELAVVGIPAWSHARTLEAIRAASPFAETHIWANQAPTSLRYLFPLEDLVLGGPHTYYEFERSDLDALVANIGQVLQALYASKVPPNEGYTGVFPLP